jgi:WXG100 family type VII secretion target
MGVVMANIVYYGSTQYKVDLDQLDDAIKTVSGSINDINGDLTAIMTLFQDVESTWKGPAGESYEGVKSALSSASSQMSGTLHDVLAAMKTSYNNYVAAEEANTHNVK